MRILTTFFCLALGFVPAVRADGDACTVATSIPGDLVRVASGSAIAGTDGETHVKGGQSAYVKVKNVNVLGVSMSVDIISDLDPPKTLCSYKAILPPQTTGIYYTAIFADPPVKWKIVVGVGDESDAGVLTYEVYSQAASAPPPPKVQSKKKQKQ